MCELERGGARSADRTPLEHPPRLAPPVEPLVGASAPEAGSALRAVCAGRARVRGAARVQRSDDNTCKTRNSDDRKERKRRATALVRLDLNACEATRDNGDDDGRDDDGEQEEPAV